MWQGADLLYFAGCFELGLWPAPAPLGLDHASGRHPAGGGLHRPDGPVAGRAGAGRDAGAVLHPRRAGFHPQRLTDGEVRQ